MSGIQARDDSTYGTVDVVSHGFGVGDPDVPSVGREVRTAEGNTVPVNPYLREYRHLPDPPAMSRRNALDVTTDGPVEVTLLGCGEPQRFG
ncbi:MAG: hypothetical protein GEU97_17415 [Actinophytocola sp.]|nr:hypothetical protein [Actinophytocola sp.]